MILMLFQVLMKSVTNHLLLVKIQMDNPVVLMHPVEVIQVKNMVIIIIIIIRDQIVIRHWIDSIPRLRAQKNQSGKNKQLEMVCYNLFT